MHSRLRKATWEILSTQAGSSRYAKVSALVSASIFALIVLNVVATILGTVDAIDRQHGTALRRFEIFSVLVFTVEYVLRVWSCVEDDEYNGAASGRFQFAKSFYALIDLAAIAPFYMTLGLDLRFARVLRLLRIFRLVKAARYFSALRLFGTVVRKKREEIVISLALLGMLTVVTSSLMYYAERVAQPEVFGSIPKAVWWSVVTVTTVGYGNATPVTVPGQMLGGIVALLGTGMGALPAGFLASGFSDALEGDSQQESREENGSGPDEDRSAFSHEIQYCPHCGSELPLRADNEDASRAHRSNGRTEAQSQDRSGASPE